MYESRGREPQSVTSASIDDKMQRTNLHQTIRRVFGGKIVTTTGDDDAIILKFSSTSKDARNVQRGPDWRALGGEYLQFVLYKENRDTMDAVSYIAKMTKQHTRKFAYAGTKDRRGVTTQLLTAHRLTADRIKGLNRALRGMRCGNFKYVQEPLELGQLKGNEFLITLRNVVADKEAIDAAMTSLRDQGFVNYYGMQRFGTSSLSTHEIGKAVIQGRWEEATELILGPRDNDTTDSDPARRHWKETHDATSTLKMFSQRNVAEHAILKSFAKNGNNKNAAGALAAVPRNMRLLYAHAYQSYVWNRVVSERVKMGTDVLEGDLVVDGEVQESADVDDIDMDDDTHDPKSWKPSAVRALDKEDLAIYSIYDIVLPTPGIAVTYPGGSLGEAYVRIMAEDGLDPHDLSRAVREYSLSGNYRRIFSKPSNLSWEVVKYNDGDQQLALTDLDRLNHRTLEATPAGQFTALQIRMSLSTAQYATMALREVTKEETSSSAQAALTDLGRDKQ